MMKWVNMSSLMGEAVGKGGERLISKGAKT